MSDEHPWRDEDILRQLYHGKGLTVREIAKELGCTSGTVTQWMKKNGIKARNYHHGRAQFLTTPEGYEKWRLRDSGPQIVVGVHQLLAIAHGYSPYDVFADNMHVHHKNGISWDNRPDNIELIPAGEHIRIHQPETYREAYKGDRR